MIKLLKVFTKARPGRSSGADEINAIRNAFDIEFYLQQNPDVAESGVDPVVHYCEFGWKEGRDPTADFSTNGYLSNTLLNLSDGINPFWHFITAIADQDAPLLDRKTQDLFTQEAQVIRDAFDVDYYQQQNPDMVKSGMDPVVHYCEFGWKMGLDPNRSFSGAYYNDTNPDVRELNLNPFWHYIIAGKAEGRFALHPGGHQVKTLLKTVPLEKTVTSWAKKNPPEKMLNADDLHQFILSASGKTPKPLMISVGHDNYKTVSGGVQYCIQKEEEVARVRGILYLNLHPYQPLPRLTNSPDTLVSIILEGALIGVAPMSAVIKTVKRLATKTPNIDVVVHHLLGHSPEQIAQMIRATANKNCWLWVHDFFTLCTNYTLQRNNVTFCDAPPQDSNACRLCLYGVERVKHAARIAKFFNDLSVDIIAPSQFSANYWTKQSDLPANSLTVCEHLVVDWKKNKNPAQENPAKPITIGFIGYPAPHKGWLVFENLVRNNSGDKSRFKFVYFGTSQIALDGVDKIPVDVTAQDPDAMITALKNRGVDIVLHWATCAETFSFSTHEAMAAGAYVLTNSLSGNVANTVKKSRLGVVFCDETELEVFFNDGRIDKLVSEKRARHRNKMAVLTRSDMVFTAIDQVHQP